MIFRIFWDQFGVSIMTINQVMQTFVILVMFPILPVTMEMYVKNYVIPIFVLHNLFFHQEDTIMHQKK